MASAPLPLFYNGLEPLSSETHKDWRLRPQETAPFLINQHAIPVTVDEFALAQRHFPIVFSMGDDAVPLALFGMNDGVNVFVDDNGQLTENVYVPAYVRRYPFMLAKLRPDQQDLSLCFDPTSDVVGAFDEGRPLFENGQPSEATQEILNFNQMFEEAGQRTAAFMAEIKSLDLLMDGETTIQQEGESQPFVYRGFQMVNEDKLRDLRGDQLRKIAQSGLLPLLYAHLFSLSLMRDVFARQLSQGRVPRPQPQISF
jgi:hypothetical protein